MAKQNLQFIADTINNILSNKVNDTSTINKIIGSANQYAQVRKFPPNKEDWNNKQLEQYFSFIERLIDMPTVYTQDELFMKKGEAK